MAEETPKLSLIGLLGVFALFEPRALFRREGESRSVLDLLVSARRDLRAGKPEAERILTERAYWWERSGDRVVIKRETPEGPEEVFEVVDA